MRNRTTPTIPPKATISPFSLPGIMVSLPVVLTCEIMKDSLELELSLGNTLTGCENPTMSAEARIRVANVSAVSLFNEIDLFWSRLACLGRY